MLEGFLHLRFGGLIFGRPFFSGRGGGGLLSEFYGIGFVVALLKDKGDKTSLHITTGVQCNPNVNHLTDT